MEGVKGMFQKLGLFAAKFRIPIFVAWVVMAILLTVFSPDLAEVSSSSQEDFLPADAPFARAQEVYKEAFPQEFSPSSTIILVDAGEGGEARDAEVWAYIQKVEGYLASDAAPDNLDKIVAPTTDPLLADKLISPNGRIALISAAITTPTDAALTTEAVGEIDQWLEDNPPEGFDVYQTGEAALNAQAEESTFTTMERTIIITIILVIVALLAIYRSPVSPLIPLATVTVAFLVTSGLVAILADHDIITVITQIHPLLVVVMYGAGTDYCLFLISRFREEMADGHSVQSATRRTIHMVGETITSSAATIFVGFISMVFSEMGGFRNAGPMLAIGIGMSLLAGLTLTPALLATLGNAAFWPNKASHRSSGRLYEITSKQVSSRPLIVILVIVALMLPFSAYGMTRDLNYDTISELPDDIASVQAYHLLRETMGGGNLFPLTVVVTGRNPEETTAEIVSLSSELNKLDEVVDVRSLNAPLGQEDARFRDLLRVDGQIQLLLNMAAGDEEETDPGQAMAVIGGIQNYMQTLAEKFPEITDDAEFLTLQEILGGGLMTIMARQQDLMLAVAGMQQTFSGMDDAYMLPPTEDGALFAELQPVLESYLADGGSTYRLEVVLDDPLGAEAMTTVHEIRELVKGYNGDGDTAVSGFTAMLADTRDVMERDQYRTFGFILAGIFLVLLVMLRSVVAPIYLIGTVLLSFTCTFGITSLFFELVFGREKLSWLLPVFMFAFLVALGIDYSIFLFGRIKEEVGHHGIREGVHVAVAATGSIITSAGVILAGTFAGMMAGEIVFLAQLGFAVSVGVLIDTFVVRTILDPALAALFGRWTWWPGGVPRTTDAKVPDRIRATGTSD